MFKWTVLVSIGFMTISANAFADEHPAGYRKTGILGILQAGMILTKTIDSIQANDKNKKINRLDKEAGGFNAINPGILFDLMYILPTGTAIYFRTPFETGYGLSPGISQYLPDGSKIDISLFYSLFRKVWKDPYLIGIARKETDDTWYGGDIRYERFMGTYLNLSYGYRLRNIDEDEAGEKIDDLRRDGVVHTPSVEYVLNFEGGHIVTAIFGYILSNMDGKSESYDGFKAKLSYAKMSGKYMINVLISGESDIYGKEHPLFDKKRKDNLYLIMGILTWRNPLVSDKFFLNLGTGFGTTDSNIDFFDKKNWFSFMTIGYEFSLLR